MGDRAPHGRGHPAEEEEAKLDYPPVLSSYPEAFQDCMALLAPHEVEVVAYAEEKDAYPLVKGTWQFVDANVSLSWHIGENSNGKIFKDELPTLTTPSVIVARVEDPDGQKLWKVIKGTHLLGLIGYFSPKKEWPQALCSLLTGNAFSGFTFAAVGLGLFVALGGR
eukprot:7476327-Pyramimonas_sp.AAC.1